MPLCVTAQTLMEGIGNVLDLEIRHSMNMACMSLPSRSRCRQAEFDTAPSIWFYVFMKTTIEMPDDLFRTVKSVAALRGQTIKQLITTAIERELTANQTIGSTELSTEDYLRRLDALAQDNATAWKTGKTAEESVVLTLPHGIGVARSEHAPGASGACQKRGTQ